MKKMERTKISRGSDKEAAKAMAEALALMDGPRRLLRPALETMAKKHGLDYLEIMLCLLIECQDWAAYSKERELVKLIAPSLVFVFRRVAGESAEVAKRELLRGLGMLPPQNAPGSSSVQ